MFSFFITLPILFLSHREIYRRYSSFNELQSYSTSEIVVGHKNLLQEFTQFAFNGQSPTYTWLKDNRVFIITFPDGTIFRRNTTFSLNTSILTASERIMHEQLAAANAFYSLECNASHSIKLKSWLAGRLNRDNKPLRLSLENIIECASRKSTILFVDLENIPDFRRNLHIDSFGSIRFSSPCVPELLQAPISPTHSNTYSILPSKDDDSTCILDDDILVLAYAHTRSPQSSKANRLTSSSFRDAADALMIYDLGALQQLQIQYQKRSFKRYILITQDRFGENAIYCPKENSFSPEGNKNCYLTVSTCAEAARLLGRLPM